MPQSGQWANPHVFDRTILPFSNCLCDICHCSIWSPRRRGGSGSFRLTNALRRFGEGREDIGFGDDSDHVPGPGMLVNVEIHLGTIRTGVRRFCPRLTPPASSASNQ